MRSITIASSGTKLCSKLFVSLTDIKMYFLTWILTNILYRMLLLEFKVAIRITGITLQSVFSGYHIAL
jgi:hypothetical protein